MPHLGTYSVSGRCSLSFLQRHPFLTDSLLADCNYDLNEVEHLIECALQAPQRCQLSQYYLQTIVTNQTTFLITNLTHSKDVQPVMIGSSWTIGRNNTCAIAITDWSVSRCHAVIGRHPVEGMYITDLGSTNGSWVNRRQLVAQERRSLRDGDLLQLGYVKAEFFTISRNHLDLELHEATYS